MCSVYGAALHFAQRPGWLDLILWRVVILARSTPVTISVGGRGEELQFGDNWTMIRWFLAGRFLDDSGVGQVARPFRSQPDVVEANGFSCRDERPSPQGPPLDQGI